MMSKVFMASIERRMAAAASVGMSSGRVMCRKRCQAFAPSTRAASSGSSGRVESPARRMSTIIGVHCHTSMKMMVLSAVSVPESQSCGARPSDFMSTLAKPMDGSKMSSHIMPTATGVATSGSRMNTRTMLWPRKVLRSSSAIARPSTSSITSAVTVK